MSSKKRTRSSNKWKNTSCSRATKAIRKFFAAGRIVHSIPAIWICAFIAICGVEQADKGICSKIELPVELVATRDLEESARGGVDRNNGGRNEGRGSVWVDERYDKENRGFSPEVSNTLAESIRQCVFSDFVKTAAADRDRVYAPWLTDQSICRILTDAGPRKPRG